MESKLLWQPQNVEETHLFSFMSAVNKRFNKNFASYDEIYRWSIEEMESFWAFLCEYLNVSFHHKPLGTLQKSAENMLGHRWFPGATLNFAENLLRQAPENETIKAYVEGLDQDVVIHKKDLERATAALQNELQLAGLNPGDRVAGVVANTWETIAGMLATTASGGVWASASPDFGTAAIIDRFKQIDPTVLFFTAGYSYNGKYFDCLYKLPEIVAALPNLQKIIVIDHLKQKVDVPHLEVESCIFSQVLEKDPAGEVQFASMRFDDPLYIMFSSGTTGVPKCIVHSVGGTLLQHKKELLLHSDVGPGSRLLYFTTCGWMMWNWMVSALSTGASLGLYEGSVSFPDLTNLWGVVSRFEVTALGTSPKFMAACQQNEIEPHKLDLSNLRTLFSTGSPLLPEQYDWVYEQVKSDVALASICGGTDIISCFILGCPIRPVYRGEIQCRGLGMAVEAWDENRHPVVGEKAELVCIKPFVSMPTGFWGTHGDEKYKEAYFSYYEDIQVWRHGDYISLTEHDGVVVYGRSDATLNPGGVRIGTSEIYRVVESVSFIEDSIAVGIPEDGDTLIWLFVKPTDSSSIPDDWETLVKKEIKTHLSPRHIPAKIVLVPDIPYTRSGKKVEMAVQKVVLGEEVKNTGALVNPEALAHFEGHLS